jgi:hypothetical protein
MTLSARLALLVLAVFALAAMPARSEEFDGVHADTLLSDEDFFRLATCGAAPGQSCRGPTTRWSTTNDLTVVLLPGETPSEQATAARITAPLDRAIATINAVGAGLVLVRVSDSEANIRIRPTDLREGTVLPGAPGISAPGIMGVGYVTLWWTDTYEIEDASILFSTQISDADLGSVVLEELFQSLGLRYDIEGPAYEGVSILSQSSNATLTIVGQDAALLRRLYPAEP